jgi:hypothetical protein
MENVLVVVPEQIAEVPVMDPGVAGVVFTVKAKVAAVDVPQAFVAVTVTFPDVEPEVTVIDVVPCPAVIVAPVGTVHV